MKSRIADGTTRSIENDTMISIVVFGPRNDLTDVLFSKVVHVADIEYVYYSYPP